MKFDFAEFYVFMIILCSKNSVESTCHSVIEKKKGFTFLKKTVMTPEKLSHSLKKKIYGAPEKVLHS